MKYLLDTNVFREVGKNGPHEHVRAWLDSVDDADLSVSVLTVREMRKGIAPSRETQARRRQENLGSGRRGACRSRREAPSDNRKDRFLWGDLLAESDKHTDDTGLAATARVHALVLVTRNLNHVAGRGADTLDPYRKQPKIELAAGSAPI